MSGKRKGIEFEKYLYKVCTKSHGIFMIVKKARQQDELMI